ncbi:MAG: o-succinylbenzoate synthase [Acidimicrobiia bacterium]|nr:o-succinylbenzoate synthase [Acidimicrobiia bacterium]MDH4364245.1 o-succinylbenzoate synthase [Acidimicrobiia bacterium]
MAAARLSIVAVLIERVEVRLLSLPMREPFGTAHGTVRQREIAVLRVETDEGHGWGECAALTDATYSDEYAAGAFDIVAGTVLPRLVGQRCDAAGALRLLADVPGHPMAKAAVEMALLDVALRSSGRSLASWLADDDPGGAGPAASVPAGAVVGLGSPADVADRVAALAAEGFGRVKIKIMPGHDREVVTAVTARCPGLALHADANGSYHATDLALLASLGDDGLGALEQPFPPARPGWAAELVAATAGSGLMVVADEAAVDLVAVQELHRRRALRGVVVKPSRLVGLAAARELHGWCRGAGLALTAGGMVETGLGRHGLAALASLPGFTVTGDVSPARRWLTADPWPDLVLAGGHIEVPSGPGVAPDPDPDVLAHYTVRRAEL